MNLEFSNSPKSVGKKLDEWGWVSQSNVGIQVSVEIQEPEWQSQALLQE